MTTSPDTATAGLEILSKADAVVVALQAAGQLSAQRIAEVVDEPLSSTYRLLQSLTAIDWIEAAPRRGHHRLGVYFMRIGGLVEDRLDVRREAFSPMRDLQRETGCAVSLFVRRETRAVCVERFDGSSVRSTALQVGDSLPLDVGAGALALLAFLPAGEQRGVLAQLSAARRETAPALRRPDDLQALLAQTRERGTARAEGDVTTGITSLAAPVFNHRGELVASVALSGLSSAMSLDEAHLVHRLALTAAAVSRLLGDEHL